MRPTKRKALAGLYGGLGLLMWFGSPDPAPRPALGSEPVADTFTPSERITVGTCETTCYYGRVDS